MKLSDCVERLVKKHRGLRRLADAAGLDPGYVSRLKNGEKTEPSDVALAALGIDRVVSYRVSRAKAKPIPSMSAVNAAAYHGDIDGDFDY